MLYIIGMIIAFGFGIYAGLGYPGTPKRNRGMVRRARPVQTLGWMRPKTRRR
jgi:hypothetical protein